jgi:hypothetical protein
MPRLVLISDTHNQHNDMPPIPEGDILIHAGDMTGLGALECRSGPVYSDRIMAALAFT